ncbi:hypothetical protein [Mesorhizobium captivum]|uniref:hypothetical protein n=1 Tax=Mesorhizobium captivum TaxID=3072319 RepID=UPI002A241A17|nr:hypothetical protein [Mesorhizobium sp. VK3C]MDX8447057.1 hypothetical protein [Mesorhizobium sp. VK3C]
MHADSDTIAIKPPTVRSRVTNGSGLFAEGGDERGPWSRRFRDLVVEHTSDAGGAAVLSEAQRSIIRRASTLEVQLEQLEARFSQGPADPADLNTYSTLSNTLRRLLADIGLERRARDVTPTLDQFVRGAAA